LTGTMTWVGLDVHARSTHAAAIDSMTGEHILAISNRAQQRLYRVNRQMRSRGKPHNVVVVACAPQLPGSSGPQRPPPRLN
jgi:hypothetical protein